MICDFCSQPDVAWRYPATDFDMKRANWGSVGDWAACETCSALIEAGDTEGLSQRSATLYTEKHELRSPGAQARMAAAFDELHRLFMANRTGERVAYP